MRLRGLAHATRECRACGSLVGFQGYLSFTSQTRKANIEEATYFVTLTVDSWVDVFTRKELVDELLKNIRFCQNNKGLELFAYVIMSNHMHFVMRRSDGSLANLLRDFKSYTAKQLLHLISTLPNEGRREWMLRHFNGVGRKSAQNKDFAFWKKDNHPIELYSPVVMN